MIKKILEYLKQILIKIINKLFKRVEDNIPDDLGANWYGPMEADPRDFKVDLILGEPKEEELKAVPKEYDILKQGENRLIPIYQGCVPSCTQSSLGNNLTLMYIIKNKDIKKIDGIEGVKLNRERMGHKWKCEGERGDYLEHCLKINKKYGLLSEISKDGKIKDYIKINRYSYFNARPELFKYWISKGYPIYYAFRGNKQTRIEMSRGEIKTYKFNPTGGHAVTAIGYDEEYLYFINTWRPNDGDLYEGDYSVFKIRWEGLNEMLKYGLANWRGWIVELDLHDNDKEMFKDYKIDESTEQGKAVKYMVENKIIKGVPHEDGVYLEPGRSVSRLELIVILYRFVKNIIEKLK